MPVSGVVVSCVQDHSEQVAGQISAMDGVEVHGMLPDGRIVAVVEADTVNDEVAIDARYAEGTPPMVPHRIDDKTSEACLACHRGAPQTPHPTRLDCTQCHGQGEITVKIKESRHEKKSKKKQKETYKDQP